MKRERSCSVDRNTVAVLGRFLGMILTQHRRRYCSYRHNCSPTIRHFLPCELQSSTIAFRSVAPTFSPHLKIPQASCVGAEEQSSLISNDKESVEP